MKKIFNWAVVYAVLGIVAGVFFREFTKLNSFEGITSLSKMHVHLFTLGMLMFLIMMLFENAFRITESKTFNKFIVFYNIGVLGAVIMLLVRGIPQVLNMALNNAMTMAISGVAGVFHIILCIGFIFMFKMIKEKAIK